MDLYSQTFLSTNLLEVEVEAFSQGSIVVDYYVKFTDLKQPLTTQVELIDGQKDRKVCR